jgi:alpha-methylacyl-CoA racemase
VAVDLKAEAGRELVLALVDDADVLVEGFRPGVMERLGLGPDVCLGRNPGLVYGRLTGWGQDGPLASAAGHDIDYIALSGALHLIGRPEERPVPPVNIVGDFAGGGLLLAFGVLAALHERTSSGRGQVVDAAMVDGAALFTTIIRGLAAAGAWSDERGTNVVDGGRPYYDTYTTADGGFIAVGAIEPQFYGELLDRLGLDLDPAAQDDPASWPATREAIAARFLQRTRDEWVADLQTTDACVAPVLSLDEAPGHPHARARSAFIEIDGVMQSAPAPRFSRTPAPRPTSPPAWGGGGRRALEGWALPDEVVSKAIAAGALVAPSVPAPVG